MDKDEEINDLQKQVESLATSLRGQASEIKSLKDTITALRADKESLDEAGKLVTHRYNVATRSAHLRGQALRGLVSVIGELTDEKLALEARELRVLSWEELDRFLKKGGSYA